MSRNSKWGTMGGPAAVVLGALFALAMLFNWQNSQIANRACGLLAGLDEALGAVEAREMQASAGTDIVGQAMLRARRSDEIDALIRGRSRVCRGRGEGVDPYYMGD